MVKSISILELQLDAKNPRFILPDTGESQENIRKYLLEQEDALSLARNIVDYGGLMPGERIVATKENGAFVVLEGNRRTCACQILVKRSLIPLDLVNKVPVANDETISAIRNVDIDVISTREEARRFLATRHIERAKEWSTIAKMRFCYEDYEHGHSVSQISERIGLTVASINKYIRKYKILVRGINSEWNEAEKSKLFILDIKPDRLLRMFELSETQKVLKLYFDADHTLKSNLVEREELDEIIHIWTKKAFIDDEMDTRTEFGEYNEQGKSSGACSFIMHILSKYLYPAPSDDSDTNTNEGDSNFKGDTTTKGNEPKDDTNAGQGESAKSKTNEEESRRDRSKGSGASGTSGTGGKKSSFFFGALNWHSVKENEFNGKGVISVCQEIFKISKSEKFIDEYPICTAFIIRSLLEQSLKYHAAKNDYYRIIKQQYNNQNGNGEPTLSSIISNYQKNIKQWIPDTNIRRLFSIVFSQQIQHDKFNLVIHAPECYTLSPDTLKSIPGEGMLAIVNFLLSDILEEKN